MNSPLIMTNNPPIEKIDMDHCNAFYTSVVVDGAKKFRDMRRNRGEKVALEKCKEKIQGARDLIKRIGGMRKRRTSRRTKRKRNTLKKNKRTKRRSLKKTRRTRRH